MYLLKLNDMRSPQVEIMQPIGIFESLDQIHRFLHAEEVSAYKDGQWNKRYRQGGPLEWFNPPIFMEESFEEFPSEEEFISKQRQRYRDYISGIPRFT